MIELSNLSKIGFGGYRIDIQNNIHGESLQTALSAGCNLIDTASNYGGGKSEQLVGKVCEANPHLKAFIISKAGYVHNSELSEVISFHKKSGVSNELLKISDQFYYSISPDYLERQIKISHRNLKRKIIDGYLIHNPEHMLKGPNALSKDELCYSLKRAFVFLEGKVKSGHIRYYGISSNTIGLEKHDQSIDHVQLVKLANEVTSNHNLKLVEFPFNLLENTLLGSKHNNELNFIEYMKKQGIFTLGNRPFNANGPTGPLRLATYDEEIINLNLEIDVCRYFDLKQEITKALHDQKYNGTVDDFQVIQYLNQNWMTIESQEQKNKIFRGFLLPFLNKIFNQRLPDSFKEFDNTVDSYVKKNTTYKAKKIISESKILDKYDKSKNIAATLCKYYLDCGIDSVLVGMRRPKYVNQLRDFFN